MLVKGLRFCLVFLCALAVQGVLASLEQPDPPIVPNYPGCDIYCGSCYTKEQAEWCPKELPKATAFGKPFCPRKNQRCCYPEVPQCFPGTCSHIVEVLPWPITYNGICAYCKPRGKRRRQWTETATKFPEWPALCGGRNSSLPYWLRCQCFLPPSPCDTQTCWVDGMQGVCAPERTPPPNWVCQGKGWGCDDDTCVCYTPWAIGLVVPSCPGPPELPEPCGPDYPFAICAPPSPPLAGLWDIGKKGSCTANSCTCWDNLILASCPELPEPCGPDLPFAICAPTSPPLAGLLDIGKWGDCTANSCTCWD